MKRFVLFAWALSSLAACKARPGDSTVQSVAIDALPARTLYHFGAYEFLRPYGKRPGTLAAGEWLATPSVRNPTGGPFRAGLYLSQHPAYNERYADGVPWLMTVTLKPECLTAERVADFTRVRPSPECSIESFAFRTSKDEACKQKAADYIGRGHGVVRDHWWEGRGFWYVADPKCIEALDASPENVLEAAASVPEMWSWNPFEGMPRDFDAPPGYRAGQTTFAVLARAIVESSSTDPKLFDRIDERARTSDMVRLRTPLVDLTRTSAACVHAGQGEVLKNELRAQLGKMQKEGPDALNLDRLHAACGVGPAPAEAPSAAAATEPSEDQRRCDRATPTGPKACAQQEGCGWSYKMNGGAGRCLHAASRVCSDYDGDDTWCRNTISAKGQFCIFANGRCRDG